jgi:adenosylcobinamide-phosphate synthase
MTPVQSWGEEAALLLWLIVVGADAIVGGLPGLKAVLDAPLAAVAGIGRWLDGRLNRARRSAASRRMRGAIVTLVIAVPAGFAGFGLAAIARDLPNGWLIEAAVVLCLLGQRRPIDGARHVAAAIAKGDLDRARRRLAPLVRYDTATLDAYGLARGAVEACATRLAGGLVGTALWYALLGLPGLCVVRAINALARAIGRPSPRQAAFGFVARRLDDVLTLIPALIAGLLFVLAALFTPSANPMAALRGWFVDLRTRPAAARAEGAVAGALGLSLGGPRPYDDGIQPGNWIGDGRARATAADIRRAALLATVMALLFATLIAAVLAGHLR